MDPNKIMAVIKSQGKKITKVRTATLEIMFENPKPLSVPEILNLLAKRGLAINKTTLYREITFLQQHKILTEVRLSPHISHFELSHLEHHHHLVCDICKKVQEIACVEIEVTIRKLEKKILKDGFDIRDHQLEFYGLCVNCK